MMKRFVPLVPLLLIAACGPAPQPAGPPAVAALVGPIEPPPIYGLIGHRQTLRLTSEQVVALDSIGQHVSSENSPLVLRLREIRGDFRGRSGADPRDGEPMSPSEEARTLMETIRRNNRAAAAGVQTVLTPEQQTRTCELFSETEQQRLRRAERRREQEVRDRGERRPARGLPRIEMQPIWPWCAPSAAPADTSEAPQR
jgi:hypothetical protein